MMFVFIWENVDYISCDTYHDDGGVAVVADSLEEARATLKSYLQEKCEEPYNKISAEKCLSKCKAYSAPPDFIWRLALDEFNDKRVIVFPNAGCC